MAEYLVRASSLEGYNKLVSNLGGDGDYLRMQVGIAAAPIPYDNWISYRAFLELLELTARELDCPHFGLYLSRQQGLSILGTVGFIMRESPDVGTALTELSKHFALHNQGGQVSLAVESGAVHLGYEINLPDHLLVKQQMDLVVGIGLNIMRLLCGPRWTPQAVYFTHSAPLDRRPYDKLFECPLHFAAESSVMIFPVATLAVEISSANHQLHSILQEHLSLVKTRYPENYPDQIKHLIRQALVTGDCSVDRVAGYLAITKRTLQRQLKSEGTAYKELLEDVRYSMATSYLVESDATLSVLADMLGYSELSAFSNAFKLKTGMSPRAWRAQYAH